MDQEIYLHILLWERGLSAGEHKLQWGLSVSLNVFWNNEAFLNGCLWVCVLEIFNFWGYLEPLLRDYSLWPPS